MILSILFVINSSLVEVPGWGPREAPSVEVCEERRGRVQEYLMKLGYDKDEFIVECTPKEIFYDH